MTVRVRLHHLRGVPGLTARPGFCSGGARAWFEAHGVPWRRFAREGVSAAWLKATGDGLAIRLAEHAEAVEAERAAQGEQREPHTDEVPRGR